MRTICRELRPIIVLVVPSLLTKYCYQLVFGLVDFGSRSDKKPNI